MLARETFDVSRFGPIAPVDAAAFKVWQTPQPVLTKTVLPAARFAVGFVGAGALTVKAPFMPFFASPGTVEV